MEEDDNHEIDDDACDFGEEESFEVVENFEEGERNIFELLVNDLMNEEEIYLMHWKVMKLVHLADRIIDNVHRNTTKNIYVRH